LLLKAQWDDSVMSYLQALRQLDSYVDILTAVLDSSDKLVYEVTGPTDGDLQQLWSWNATLPPTFDQGVHDIISSRAKGYPGRLAVESWDGSHTYGEIEDLSTKLAHYLRSRGVQIGTVVPLCFEKSRWTVVAVLAIMKAGGTFSLTDPSQPEARLQTIVEQTSARLIITSKNQRELGHRIAPQAEIVSISEDFFLETSIWIEKDLLPVPSNTPMYVIFTSGSTGKPKGVMISHLNYTSGAIPRADAVGYRDHSRVFDFASYAFDVSIDCMLCTLTNGGCICIPSDEARMNDLSSAIRDSKANMAHMTPSVARVLDPDIIPSLEVLGLGGEAVSAGDASTWSKNATVVIAYGPSECTVGCTINNNVRRSTNIGSGVGGLTWIVDPEDHNRLMPIGAVGELLIEGPVVGIGYLNDPEKTKQGFVEDPTWLLVGGGCTSGRHGRLYKTGDLVKYDPDGSDSIVFVGRKDQQVKLRGQRVELAEVEHHLQNKLPSGIKLAAEVIKPNGGEPALVAFLVEQKGSQQQTNGDTIISSFSADLGQALADIDKLLGVEIPRYMVPSAYIPLYQMPSLVSGKTDRKKLRELGASMTREQVARLRAVDTRKRRPETEMEEALCRLWIRVLQTDEEVGLDDSFFGLGGDSLRAMRLVSAAREAGILLTVGIIFNFPVLSDMAANATKVAPQSGPVEIPAFSLLETDWSADAAKTETAKLCGISESAVEDVYPCTPLQEGLMALSAKVKEAYIAQRVVDLASDTAAQKLRTALDETTENCSILRTRIVQASEHGLVQVLVKEDINWHFSDNLAEYLESDRDEGMDLGKPLVRYGLVTDKISEKIHFVLTMHHALYDGWSMPLVVERINQAYEGRTTGRPAEFKHFIQYLNSVDRESCEKYWKDQLDGANGPQFPPIPYAGYQTQADSLLELYVPLNRRQGATATVATVVRAAWALVASQYTSSNDVVFGETLTGRNAPISGADEIEGPMITTVPFRVRINRDATVSEFLQSIQDQTVEQIPYEHTGLQHIRRLSPDALQACELRAGLVLHPSADGESADPSADDMPANRLVPAGDSEAAQEALKFNTYGLMLVCSLDAKGFFIMASFDSKTADKPLMERVLAQLSTVAQQLCEKSDAWISDIMCLTSEDRDEIQRLTTTAASSLSQEYPSAVGAWIVNPADRRQTLPRGAIGELLVCSNSDLILETISLPELLKDVRSAHSEAAIYGTSRLAKIDPSGAVAFVGNQHEAELLANTRKSAPSKRVSATSAKQRKLRSLWSRVLRLPEEDIGLNDIFFQLGGDSIAAMKLVSEARLKGMHLTVKQIFSNRSLYDMAKAIEDSTSLSEPEVVEETAPFSLLGEIPDMQVFIHDTVRPALSNQEWKILNVLPARPLQGVAVQGTINLPKFSARYEVMYFEGDVDRLQLFKSCQELVARNEILRTVFIERESQYYGVVIEEMKVLIEEYDIDGDLQEFTHKLCNLDVQTRMPLGSAFVKFFFVQAVSGQSCLIFRISHAQYDEICLPLGLRQLSALYEGRSVQETIPFSSFVGHVVKKSIPQSIDYWTDLLKGSTMSAVRPEVEPKLRNHYAIDRTLDISSRSKDTTVATLPTAAWALCLARRQATRDVTFGEVVSGRNIDFPNADNVMGPCWQYVPVRVQFQPDWTAQDLLDFIQHQHIASSAHEGIGLSEIISKCTEWPSSMDWFDTVVHQDVEHVESLDFVAASSRMETIYPHQEPLREWKIQAFVQGDRLTMEIVTFESWSEYAAGLLDDLMDALEFLVRNSGDLIFKSTETVMGQTVDTETEPIAEVVDAAVTTTVA
jgi:fusarinine C synthase